MIVPFPLLGDVNAILIEDISNTVSELIVGESDIVVIDVDALDEVDVPPEFVAVTVNVYIVFDDNLDTVIGDDDPVPINPPILLVIV